MHHEYLQGVLWHIRQAQQNAASIRRRASALAERGRFGADPTRALLALPRPGLTVHPQVMQAAGRAFGTPSNVYEGFVAAHRAQSPEALDAARAAIQGGRNLAGFDAGIALACGAARTRGVAPRRLGPGGRAGWYMTFGIEGAGADVAGQVLGTAAQATGVAPGVMQGVQTAITTMDGGGDVPTALLSYGGIPLGVLSAASLTGLVRLGLGAVLGLSALGGLAAVAVGAAFGLPGATAIVKAAQARVSALTQSVEKSAT